MIDSKIIEDFYKGDQGIEFHANINNSIKDLWPEITDENIIIIGYGAPYLADFHQSNNVVTINSFDSFSFSAEYADRIILLHSIEFEEQPSLLLREVWRIIKPGGKLLVIAPSKYGPYFDSKDPPFNNSRFFTINQLISLLSDSLFEPSKIRATLFSSYNFNKSFPAFAKFIGSICDKWFALFGGVLLIEAEKKLVVATNKNRAKKQLSLKQKWQKSSRIRSN